MVTTGIIAILCGGLLSAFSARKPNRFSSWASAYLVLVSGLLQVIMGLGTYYLVEQYSSGLLFSAFIMFNLGNIGVILGTKLKAESKRYRLFVDGGGGLLVIALAVFLSIMRSASLSWQLIVLDLVTLLILISIPTGLVLARRIKH